MRTFLLRSLPIVTAAVIGLSFESLLESTLISSSSFVSAEYSVSVPSLPSPSQSHRLSYNRVPRHHPSRLQREENDIDRIESKLNSILNRLEAELERMAPHTEDPAATEDEEDEADQFDELQSTGLSWVPSHILDFDPDYPQWAAPTLSILADSIHHPNATLHYPHLADPNENEGGREDEPERRSKEANQDSPDADVDVDTDAGADADSAEFPGLFAGRGKGRNKAATKPTGPPPSPSCNRGGFDRCGSRRTDRAGYLTVGFAPGTHIYKAVDPSKVNPAQWVSWFQGKPSPNPTWFGSQPTTQHYIDFWYTGKNGQPAGKIMQFEFTKTGVFIYANDIRSIVLAANNYAKSGWQQADSGWFKNDVWSWSDMPTATTDEIRLLQSGQTHESRSN